MKNENEEKKEEKKVSISGFSFKKYWKLQISLLLIFLLGFGFISYFLLGNQAYKLVGGSSYNETSRNSFGSNKKSLLKKIISYFSSEEKDILIEEKNNLNTLSSLNANDTSTNSNINTNVTNNNSSNMASNSGSNSYSNYSSNGSKLSSRLNNFSSISSGGKSKTEVSNFTEGSKNLSAKLTDIKQTGMKNSVQKKEKGGALEALKGAWKSSLYGARLSSQDAAKSWTARAFDSSPEATKSIQYEEKFKAKLDTLNPNAIPKFLKEQNIELDALDSAKPDKIPEFDVDNSAKEEKAQKDQETKKKLFEGLSSGLINPMYGSSDNNEEDPSSMTDPDSRAFLPPSITMDDYGYLRVTDSSGFVQIYDGSTGAIVGCEDPTAGMCVMPGAGTCPSGTYFI